MPLLVVVVTLGMDVSRGIVEFYPALEVLLAQKEALSVPIFSEISGRFLNIGGDSVFVPCWEVCTDGTVACFEGRAARLRFLLVPRAYKKWNRTIGVWVEVGVVSAWREATCCAIRLFVGRREVLTCKQILWIREKCFERKPWMQALVLHDDFFFEDETMTTPIKMKSVNEGI